MQTIKSCVKGLSAEYDVLLKLLSNSLFKTDYKFTNVIDWEKVFKESLSQTVVSIAFDGLNNAEIPEEVKDKWFMYSVKNLQNNYAIHNQHKCLHKLMSDNNVSYCVLKGSASAFYYPNQTLRSMGDVDFFVPHKDFKRALDVFLANDFGVCGEPNDAHIVLKKNEMHFEMHFEPPGIPKTKARETIEKYFTTLTESGSVEKIGDNEFYNPDKLNHGLILLLHTCHHLLREGIGLRHLCDWAVFVNSFEKNEFALMFKEKLKEIGMWEFACILTVASVKYLNMPMPQGVETSFDKFEEFMLDILDGGNFGGKEKNRYFESLYIATNGEVGNNGKIKQFIKAINEIIFKKFRWLEKCKVLLPFFWLFYGGRYLFRMILGKRKAIVSKDIASSADERINIYKDFHTFETKKN